MVHTDPEKSPETENLPPLVEGRERQKKEAGHSSLEINDVLRQVQAGGSPWRCLAGAKELYRVKGGIAWVLVCECYQVREITFLTRSRQWLTQEPAHGGRQERGADLCQNEH